MAEKTVEREATAPDPEDERKPDSPTDITGKSWKYIFLKTVREFTSDQCTDLAAALTYFGVLAVFPALLAFVSILGLVGDAQTTTNGIIDIVRPLVPGGILKTLETIITDLTKTPAAGLGLVTGIVGALWSASGYVGAFGRAMNRIYAVREGRPFWKLRPVTLLVTVIAIVVAVIAAILLVVSGPIARQLGSIIGLGDGAVLAWNIVKWPVLVALVVMIIAILYYATPNVKQPKFRWMSVGALFAIVVWAIASAAFAFYAANFSSYNATYGSIGGVIVFLLWVWITNIALLFGAELDAEIERGRQLQAGIKAEEEIQLPPRDTTQTRKQDDKRAKDVRTGRALRLSSGEADGSDAANASEKPEPDNRDKSRSEKK